MKSCSAFTLIELLVVVAVISILAAIAVPNFLEAQVRAKVSRTHADMASVASALRSYVADYNRYPPNNREVHRFLTAAAGVTNLNATTLPTPPDAPLSWTQDDPDASQRRSFEEAGYNVGASRYGFSGPYPVLLTAGYDLSVLTTPVSYLHGSLPVDPFQDNKGVPFLYVNLADLGESPDDPGPGGRYRRYVLLSYGPNTDSAAPSFNPARGPFLPYDPTNGTVSKGDIVLFGDDSPVMRSGDTSSPSHPPASQGPGMDYFNMPI